MKDFYKSDLSIIRKKIDWVSLNAVVRKSAFVMRPIKITIKSDLNPKSFFDESHDEITW